MPRRLSDQALKKGNGEIAITFLQEGFVNFQAVSTNDAGDGSEECTVTLHYTGGSVEGKTGNGHGHAEMDALHQLWADVCNKDVDTFLTYSRNLKLDCTDKPCCVKCSTVLGWMGVVPRTTATKKTPYTMGKTSWNVSTDVLNLIREVTRVPTDAFQQFANMSQSDVHKHL
jgi:hypothetical protein